MVESGGKGSRADSPQKVPLRYKAYSSTEDPLAGTKVGGAMCTI